MGCNLHDWSNDKVDWKGISDAASYIYNYLKRWRVPVRDHKEKYGTVRVYTGLGWERGWLFQHLLYPNYIYYQFPQWVRRIDYMIPCHWLNVILVPFYKYLYTRAYGNALRKWPHLRAEILRGADFNELLQKYGVHTIRKSANCYEIHYDWHPDNYVYPDPVEEEEDEVSSPNTPSK